jgi:hypothetical protein
MSCWMRQLTMARRAREVPSEGMVMRVTGLFHAAELMYLVGCAERGQYRVSVVVLGNGQLQSRCEICESCCLFFPRQNP